MSLLISCSSSMQKTSTNNTFDEENMEKVESENKKYSLDFFIHDLLDHTDSYIPQWNQESFKGKWNYIDGVFLNSIIELYNQTNNKKYIDFVKNFVDYYLDENGNFRSPKPDMPGFTTGELDSICESRVLFNLYIYTLNHKYMNAIENTYDYLMNVPRTTNGYNFCHKVSYPNQIWLDGMYMYVPFYLRYALLKGKEEIFDEVTKQYKYIRDYAFNTEKKLYYHAHDTSKEIFWCDKQTGNSPSFWLRSTGWFIVSLVDSLEFFPDGENREYLNSLLKEAIEGVMQYQDKETKMFYQVIDRGGESCKVPSEKLRALKNKLYNPDVDYVEIANYVESSGSSMIAYVCMKGARLGYLDASFAKKGREIYEAIFDHSYSNGKLNDICITAGLGPASNPVRDGTFAYYLAEPVGSNDAKGIGPFIMAYLEYKNLNY